MSTEAPTIHETTAISDTDHGALVKVAAGFCTALMLLALTARMQIRWPWKSLFGRDDAAVLVASALAVVQMVIAIHAVSRGLGKVVDSLSLAAIQSVEKILYASNLLFVLDVFLAKTACGLLYHRLSADPKLGRAVAVLTIAPSVCGVLAVILVAVPVSSSEPWSFGPENATGRTGCWIAITSMSIVIEIGMLAFPIWLVKDLHMGRSRKIAIVGSTWVRLPLIAISVFRLLSFRRAIHSDEPAFHSAMTEMLTQTEMAYTLISATAPCLHNFLRFANSGITDMTVGTSGAVETIYGKMSGVRSGQQTSGRSHNLKAGFENVKLVSLGRSQNTATAAHADSVSIASDSSQRNIVVRRTVDVQYGGMDDAVQREVPVQHPGNNRF